MSLAATDNKQLIKDYLQALSGQPKTEELVDQYVSDASLKEHIAQAEAAFPSYEVELQQMVAEDDWIACRATFRGVHRGNFAGVSTTGRHVSSDFMIFYRVDDGRIVQHWMQLDVHDILRQLTA
jgi:predicted ester cyclase